MRVDSSGTTTRTQGKKVKKSKNKFTKETMEPYFKGNKLLFFRIGLSESSLNKLSGGVPL